jgi:MSHA pilin protein MshC
MVVGMQAAQRGFTLIELIMTMVLMGVLAAVAVPRIFNVSAFDARGFHDQTLAYLRFAQKTAVAQRRTVCVTLATVPNSSVTLAMAAAAGTYDCATPATLVVPLGQSSAVLNAKSGVSFNGTPASFNFDSLGQPITASGAAKATQILQVNGASESITIEAATGYVHE